MKILKNAIAKRMGTQYGCHDGYDALEYAEMVAPRPDLGGMGAPKGDNNRGNKGNQVNGSFFTAGKAPR